MLAVASVIASAGNYAVNLYTARSLTPAEFSDTNLMVTIMLTVTSVALGLQLVAAHVVSHDSSRNEVESASRVRFLRRWSWVAGAVVGSVLALGSPFWSLFFNTASAVPFIILGAGMPFYFAQAVSRGVLQGRLAFAPLAWSYVVEMIARVGLVVVLVSWGAGVEGATVGLAVSFVVTWVAVALAAKPLEKSSELRAASTPSLRRYAGFVAVLLVGQMIANNSDVFAAKIFLEPTEAGIYSSVALIGRAVFFVSWSVATVVFPAVARKSRHGGGQTLLIGGILAIAVMGTLSTFGALLFGGPSMEFLFGAEYTDLGIPLAAYAAMTTVWAVANLIATGRLSLEKNDASWIILVGGCLQVLLLAFLHGDMMQLIIAQAWAAGVVIVALATRPNILLTNSQESGRRGPAAGPQRG
jgi:O-antigen/teichoic acid export membrane protein